VGFYIENVKGTIFLKSTFTLYNAVNCDNYMHRREQIIYLQLVMIIQKVTYLHIFKIENCLVVHIVGLDL
jgi:hypothetical protein